MQLPASTMASAYRAGRSAGQNYVDIQRETNKYANKPAEINKVAYKAQMAEKTVAMEVDARAKKNEITAQSITDRNDVKVKALKDKQKAAKSERKAGILAGIGMIASDIITENKMGEAPRRERPDDSISRDYYTKAQARLDADVKANMERTKADEAKWAASGNTAAGSTNTAAANSDVTGIKTGAYTGSLDSLSAKDKRDIAYIVSSEAERGTDDEFGVAGVVLNRMKSGNYPTSAYDVGHQKGQFEGVEMGNSRYDKALEDRLFSPTGLQKLESALKTLDGRQSFKGQALLGNRVAAEDPMFHSRGNFFHYDYQ